LFRIRPLAAASCGSYFRRTIPTSSTRGFATRQTSSSLNDPNPNWSNRPPKETILLDGCDFEHWLVVMEKPEGDPTRDEIIDSYIKTLAMVVGSEEEARMKIYSVSTRHYFAFGALVSEDLSYKLKELPRVRWVLPDSYLDVKNKDYGGEPFINGQAVPYDPKYHEEWVRNNNRANERNRRNDRPRNFDRSRNFERRQQMPNQSGYGGNSFSGTSPPPPNAGQPQQPNFAPSMTPPNAGQPQQPNFAPNMPPPPGSMVGGQQQPGYVPNAPPPPPPNPPHSGQMGYPNYGPGAPPNNNPGYMRPPPNNAPYPSGPNSGGPQYQPGPTNGPQYQPPPGPGGFAPRGGPPPSQGQFENPNFRPGAN
ncbi:hypothetical protein M569_00328, partial [Genlisea aurea]